RPAWAAPNPFHPTRGAVPMMSRKTRTILAVAVIAGVFGYRAMQHKPDAPDAAAGKADAAPVAPVEPVKLGSIAFTPCSLSAPMSRASLEAQCATFEVPEDRANPAGRKIALNVA